MTHQSSKIGCVYKTPFRKSGHIYCIYVIRLILCFTGIFVLVPIFWKKDLLCSHDNLFIAVAEPTTFCQLQGMYVCI